MECDHERHLVELADKLVDHQHLRMLEAQEHMQELLEAIPGACQHVGIPRPGRLFPWVEDQTFFLRRPIRRGPKRELDNECRDAIQDFYEFRLIDMYRHTTLWLKAMDMRDRFRDRLEQCEHANKGA